MVPFILGNFMVPCPVRDISISGVRGKDAAALTAYSEGLDDWKHD